MSRSLKPPKLQRRARWSRKDRMLLLERLHMYVASGLPIDRAIDAAGEGLPRRQAAHLSLIRLRVEGGQPLSSALAAEMRYPGAVIGLVASGETSGSLAKSLDAGFRLLEREDEMAKKCLSAMAYPVVIGIAAGGLTIGLVRGVLPQIIPLLSGLHSDLPLLTRIVIRCSDDLVSRGVPMLAGVIIAAIAIRALYKRSRHVRAFMQLAALKSPLIGGIMSRYALSLFFASLGTLSDAGAPIDEAFDRSVASVGLIPVRKRLGAAMPQIIAGSPIHPHFAKGMPGYVSPLIAAGEKSGNLPQALMRVTAILDREIDNRLKQATALVEPVMMLGMGFIVGSIALSIMLPIYDISRALQR